MIGSDTLTAFQTTVSSDLEALLPVGVAIMGLMVGLRLIPRVVYSFL